MSVKHGTTQTANTYAVGGTNEKVQMEDLARRIKVILDAEYDCETVMATISLGIGSDGRPKEAKTKGCDVYLAIHSLLRNCKKADRNFSIYTL